MRFLPPLLALGLALGLTANTRASLPPLALFTGSLQGETKITGFPALAWTLVAPPARENHKTATLTLSGDGLALRIQLEADLQTETVTWRIDEGRAPLGPWFKLIAPRISSATSGATIDGEFLLTGGGTLDAGNHPLGQLTLSCQNITLQNPLEGWSLNGISFSGKFSTGSGAILASTSPATLDIATITTARFGARNLTITGSLLNLDEALITRAHIEIAGGKVETLEPFSFPLSPPAIDTHVRIQSVGLQDFVALIPSGLSAARGKLNGQLRLTWSPPDGIQLGIGALALDEVEPTVIRLARSPGFLTGSMPARIELLPGFLGRIFFAPNPSLKDIQQIELGQTELEVSSLRILISPEGDANGRSAYAQVDARPIQPGGTVKRVTFDINVDGPFSSLMRLGLNHPFTIQVR